MDGTIVSKNGSIFQSRSMLPDGTIEITDTLPKQDYYKSLRRNSTSAAGSQFTVNNSQNVYDATLGQKKSKPMDYKPSGKEVQCNVLMLEGVEHAFMIDRNSYGIHLFKAVCDKLELAETEYFGLTFRGNQHVDMWLRMDEKLTKQLDRNPWKFEFRFKFYPARPEYLKDDLTRYFLCLQLRQDIICGQLPCSFNTYVILGAYVIQSEAGDHDPEVHEGIDYLFNVPFAPRDMQTPEMLVRIADMHRHLKGRTPEQADRMFLENARRMALYGVHLHRVKAPSGEDLSLGIYHSGVMIYRGRLRMQRYSWARIVELSYRGKDFTMVVRPVVYEEYIESPGGARRRTSTASASATRAQNDDANKSQPPPRSNSRQRSTSAKPSANAMRNKTLTFKCLNAELAKRLYSIVVDHHFFFRLRESGVSKRHNLQPGFGTRKYHYNSRPQIFEDDESTAWTLNRDGALPPSGSIRRVTAQRKPEQYARTLVTLMTPVAPRKGNNFRAPCASVEDADIVANGSRSARSTFLEGHESSILMEDSYAPVKVSPGQQQHQQYAAPPSAGWSEQIRPNQTSSGLMAASPAAGMPRLRRPEMTREHWQMSPADCTQGLGMDLHGTDVATMKDAGWQGSRTNRGVKGPGSYYYEVVILEDGDVRVGWSTNHSSLMLGMDSEGYGYGADESGDGSHLKQSAMGRLMHSGEVHEMGFAAGVSDVIGCFLQLTPTHALDGSLEGNVMWSHNGSIVTSPHANLVRIPAHVATNNGLFPTVSLRDARICVNFGEKPFIHSPDQMTGGRLHWTAPVDVPDDQTVRNYNCGWRINQHDTTATLNLIVSEDGRMIQTTDSSEWQGFRANKGVYEAGKYYYEVEMVEDTGFARFGWALPDGSLQIGTDNKGYGFGAGPDGSPGKKFFNKEIDNYGTAVQCGDVVGCFLDLDEGNIFWSVNGTPFPSAYHMDSSFISHPKTVFFPAASLLSTTLEVNYGDRPFKYQPTEEWYPLFAAADDYVQDSLKWPRENHKRPTATTDRVESEIQRPDLTIEVNRQSTEKTARIGSLDDDGEDDDGAEGETSSIKKMPLGSARSSSHDEDDTVICTASDVEQQVPATAASPLAEMQTNQSGETYEKDKLRSANEM